MRDKLLSKNEKRVVDLKEMIKNAGQECEQFKVSQILRPHRYQSDMRSSGMHSEQPGWSCTRLLFPEAQKGARINM